MSLSTSNSKNTLRGSISSSSKKSRNSTFNPRASSFKRNLNGKVVETENKKIEISGDLLKGAELQESFSAEDLPDVQALNDWFSDKGLDTSDWGQGNTKPVKKFWSEIHDKESGLELWKKADGSLQPVRTTHVLRAKVCSPESFKRGVFLFNTWQQYGDGRRRVRNGLLSEKLTLAEMPLEDHLAEVCSRAVTEEEMQRLADPLLKIGPGMSPPRYDRNYVCPLEVVDYYFVDHVIEVEASKSYPRLVTMYHLYTVDILCTGLPVADFNTLEFEHPDAENPDSEDRDLKYIHAWIWMEWSEIQRYLFEGSKMKERKQRESFNSPEELYGWLETFDLDLESWGKGHFKPVESLFDELENEETHLELWGRQDGVPLLMRVLHVMQLKVCSTDSRLVGKFLYHTWSQKRDGHHRAVNRLMYKKLKIGASPLDRENLEQEAQETVRGQLSYLADPHFRLVPDDPPNIETLEKNEVAVHKVTFHDHRVDVENSPTFKGLCTLYHLYTCEVECEGLPLANFSSLEVRNQSQEMGRVCSIRDNAPSGPYVKGVDGWCWVVLPQCMDMAHSQNLELESQLDDQKMSMLKQDRLLQDKADATSSMMAEILSLVHDPKMPKQVTSKIEQLIEKNREREKTELEDTNRITDDVQRRTHTQTQRRLPPSMLSEMSENALMTADALATHETPIVLKESDGDAVERKPCDFLWCTSFSC